MMDEKKQPATGRGGKYNFPQTQLKRLEEDDKKRVVIGKSLNNCLVFYEAGQNRVKNDEELCDRLNWFFRTCAQANQIPTVEKMCLSLGYDRNTVLGWETGHSGGFSPATSSTIKKAKNVIASLDAELALDSKIQPIVYMFRAKNYYGMKDVQDVVITPNASPLGDEANAEEIMKKLNGAKIIEVEEFKIDDEGN